MKIRGDDRRRFPLHVHIAVIFAALILALGVILAGFSYAQISNLISASTDELFREIGEDVVGTFQQDYRAVTKSVELLSNSTIATATSFDERQQQLPILAQALRDHPHVSGLNIGYQNGDYMVVRLAEADLVRESFETPLEAYLIVDHVSQNARGVRTLLRSFVNDKFVTIQSEAETESNYDPRLRPWYHSALQADGPQFTPPYLFYFLNRLGITISKRAPGGSSVIAADVSLEGLSRTLAERDISPSAISILFNEQGEIYAYNDHEGSSILSKTSSNEVLTTAELNNPIIDSIRATRPKTRQSIPFQHEGSDWLGDIRNIRFNDQLKLNLFVAAPERELFAPAIEFRRSSLLITLATILIAILIALLLANQVARPLRKLSDEARSIANFDFARSFDTDSIIKEIHELSHSMDTMRITIGNFLRLITSLSGESDVNRLMSRVCQETMDASDADAALIYLLSDDETELLPTTVNLSNADNVTIEQLASLSLVHRTDQHPLIEYYENNIAGTLTLCREQQAGRGIAPLFDKLAADQLTINALPLRDRNQESTGVLCLVYASSHSEIDSATSQRRLGFSRALSGFAAVSMESRQLINRQKALLQSFIELIASAIDAKSPYTGGHCQRVPQLTKMLAAAACESQDEPFSDFSLNDDQWEELHIASWLHDCGKVTTPEYVVDKSTKLETIYDRIHEIRMRFEVLKRDAEIDYWRALAQGENRTGLEATLTQKLAELDEDFAFVAECNVGSEYMSDESVERLRQISARTWRRTLDDRMGISWEENQRKSRTRPLALPAIEPLIADKPEHIFPRSDEERIPADNPYGFKVEVPEHKYNRGELYNLAVKKGTLTTEERYKINEHMTQTITMLNQLPYPRHLRNVPAIAGGHHETMDGKGYPKRLRKEDMSLSARMMAIADIFEALTASDRPYKKAKTLTESIKIMQVMKANQHIDPDLFELFLRAGVYRDYAREYLRAEQIDEVKIEEFID